MRPAASAALLVLCEMLSACQRKEQAPTQQARPPITGAEAESARAFLSHYASIAHAAYADSVTAARALAAEVNAFVAEPSADGLKAVKASWIAARHPYAQTETFRFYDGPVDRIEMLINTWPIDENYVEAGPGSATPGIVENVADFPTLTSTLLVAENAKTGETSVSTGYHVIEFLLWGRDRRADGPGDRKHSDYVGNDSPVPARRGTYLKLASELLVRELAELESAWADGPPNNYRAEFLKRPPGEALGLVIKGMGTLSGPELSGERMMVAYETKDQENEHSCFSDTTQSDLLGNARGLQNLCSGRYQRLDGTTLSGVGLCEFLAQRDAALAQRLRDELAASVSAVAAVPNPFDQAILGDDAAPGRIAIQRAIRSLEQQTKTLTKVAELYDVRVTLALQKP